ATRRRRASGSRRSPAAGTGPSSRTTPPRRPRGRGRRPRRGPPRRGRPAAPRSRRPRRARRPPAARTARSPLPLLVVVEPPARDLLARGDPDVARLEAVLDHLAQRRDAARLAEQARVRPDREHRRVAARGLAPDLVEAAPHRLREVRRRGEALREDEARVVVGERVGHDEVPLAARLDEVGQVVVVGVGVVDEPALLDDELAGVDARRPAVVAADRRAAAGPRERLDRERDPPPLLLAVEQPHLLPAPAARHAHPPRSLAKHCSTIRSSVRSSPRSSATTSPSRNTSTRSQRCARSSYSTLAIMTAPPASARSRICPKICCFAPMSTPCVGSCRRKTCGRVANHFASSAFCWLPPESFANTRPGSGGTTWNSRRRAATARRSRRCRRRPRLK